MHGHDHGHTHSHEHTQAVSNRLAHAIGQLEAVKHRVEDGRGVRPREKKRRFP